MNQLTKKPAPRGSLFSFAPLWDDFFARDFAGMKAPVQVPVAMDVTESSEALTISAELPGMAKSDVTITIEDVVLSISGEKKSKAEKKEEGYHLIERSYGSFHRSLKLPRLVDTGAAKASFEDGVLMIELPKQEQIKPKRLEIN